MRRRRFLERAGLTGSSLAVATLGRKVFQVISELNNTLSTTLSLLNKFEFEVVTVNAQGQIIKQRRSQAQLFSEDLGNGITLEMIEIPGGKFLMGTTDREIARLEQKLNWSVFQRERPQHQVTLTPFFLGKYPITQRQWRAVASLPKVKQELQPNPSHFQGDNLPVESISWYDAMEFGRRLSRETGRKYRLPSEAEWEYACRAMTTTPFYFGETLSSELANYDARKTYATEPQGGYRKKTTTVGSFPPNAFGLYDRHGNVWEWCADRWHENYEGAPTDGSAWLEGAGDRRCLLRGGSWHSHPGYCRSAFRFSDYPDVHLNFYGLRVACDMTAR